MSRSIVATLAFMAGIGATAAGQTELLRFRGAVPDDSYGWALGPAGDVDGDGVADFLVGSDEDDTNGTDAGRVRVLSGRDGSVLREHFGDKAHDRLGFAIGKEVGDVDGDGFDDYALGAMETADLASYGLGYVRVFSGPTGLMIREWVGTELEAAYGERPSVIGDIDNDGFADVAVGAIFANPGGVPSAGEAWIYSGADGSTLWSKGGTTPSEYYGCAIAPVGLVDADGFLDFAVGAFGKRVNGYWRGGAEVLSGSTGAVLFSELGGVNDLFGWSLAGVGDLDGDGVPDLLVGSNNDNGPIVPGEAHVYSLKTGTELYCFAGPTDGDLFGHAVAGLDDLDGDGVNEFLITAPVGSYYQPWTGHVYIYSGHRGRLLFDLETGAQDDVFGFDAMVLGDVDGDGKRDWLVGAPNGKAYGVPNAPGAVHLFTAADCHASAQNYGAGWPGTLGVPSLAASNPPWLGEPIDIVLGNSYGQPTIALVLMGFSKAQIASSWDGDFLVAPPWISFTFALPTGGLTLPEAVDADVSLCGVEVDVQLLLADPGASDGIAFSAGLELLLGGR